MEKIIYQERDGELQVVYRGRECEELPGLRVGQRIYHPNEQHIEGTSHITLRRIQ